MKQSLIKILQLHDKGIISIIGAGGKTSLMFELAKQLVRSKKKVLTTTTTKIFLPEPWQTPETLIANDVENDVEKLIQKAKSTLNSFNHFSAGSSHDLTSNKLKGFKPETIELLWQAKLFDWIIVEADGAKQKPLKASGPHEPVIVKETTHLIYVAGLDAVGKTLNEKHVHRAKIFSNNTGLDMGKTIDEKSIATSIDFEIKKATSFSTTSFCTCPLNFLFLNKADTISQKASGEKIKKFITNIKNIKKTIIASLDYSVT